MSIGCLIGITSEDGERQKALLYIHDGGTPVEVFNLIETALDRFFAEDSYRIASRRLGQSKAMQREVGSWQVKRAGKVASALCAVRPVDVEPRVDSKLKTDFYYDIEIGKSAQWFVTVLRTMMGGRRETLFEGHYEEFRDWVEGGAE